MARRHKMRQFARHPRSPSLATADKNAEPGIAAWCLDKPQADIVKRRGGPVLRRS